MMVNKNFNTILAEALKTQKEEDMKIEVGLKLEGICYGCPRFSGRVVRQMVYGETVSAKVICYHEEACKRILEICGKEEEHGEIH